MEDKTKFITPLSMLFAGAIASIIMYARGYEFTKMLWVLLIVLVVFYIIGDTARYIYSRIRPRIVTVSDFGELERIARANLDQTGNIVEFANEEKTEGEGTAEDEEETEIDTDSEKESYDEGD
jgi:hypothetical protein